MLIHRDATEFCLLTSYLATLQNCLLVLIGCFVCVCVCVMDCNFLNVFKTTLSLPIRRLCTNTLCNTS